MAPISSVFQGLIIVNYLITAIDRYFLRMKALFRDIKIPRYSYGKPLGLRSNMLQIASLFGSIIIPSVSRLPASQSLLNQAVCSSCERQGCSPTKYGIYAAGDAT